MKFLFLRPALHMLPLALAFTLGTLAQATDPTPPIAASESSLRDDLSILFNLEGIDPEAVKVEARFIRFANKEVNTFQRTTGSFPVDRGIQFDPLSQTQILVKGMPDFARSLPNGYYGQILTFYAEHPTSGLLVRIQHPQFFRAYRGRIKPVSFEDYSAKFDRKTLVTQKNGEREIAGKGRVAQRIHAPQIEGYDKPIESGERYSQPSYVERNEY